MLNHKRFSIALDQDTIAAIEKAVNAGDQKQALAVARTLSKLVKMARSSKCGIPADKPQK